MCECGCTSNDVRYTFPAPGKATYLLTLSAGCTDCDAPSGVTIERIEPGSHMEKMLKEERDEWTEGELKFEQWPDSKGVAIVTGFLKHEFVKTLQSHLVGVSSDELGDEGLIDETGAEVILEEMYEDSTFKPFIVEPVVRQSEPTDLEAQ